MNRYYFHIESNACSGCKTCVAACKDLHDLPVGVNFRHIIMAETGEWKNADGIITGVPGAYNLSVSCNHCADPHCVTGCPTGAMQINGKGVVIVDETLCMGCGYCTWNCPYEAPVINPNTGKAGKCDMCIDRLDKGVDPVCVEACPLRSIHITTEQDNGFNPEEAAVYPLPDPAITKPSLLITRHRSAVTGNYKKTHKKSKNG